MGNRRVKHPLNVAREARKKYFPLLGIEALGVNRRQSFNAIWALDPIVSAKPKKALAS